MKAAVVEPPKKEEVKVPVAPPKEKIVAPKPVQPLTTDKQITEKLEELKKEDEIAKKKEVVVPAEKKAEPIPKKVDEKVELLL